MSPRRNQKKTASQKTSKGERLSSKDAQLSSRKVNDSSDDSDESIKSGSGMAHNKDLRNGKDDTPLTENEKCCRGWLQLCKKMRQERENCIKIYVLSPFLFGVGSPGLEDKMVDWSCECHLLPTNEIVQTFAITDQTFETLRVIEDVFCVLADYWTSKDRVVNILKLKDKFIKQSSVTDAIKCAEANQWFRTLRSSVKFLANSKKEIGDMSFLLVIYHFAGHLRRSTDDDDDIFKKFQEDCQLKEDNVLELKEKGNSEFFRENYRAAVSLYSRAVVVRPFNYIVYGNRAQTHLKLGDYTKALIDAKRSVVLKPDWDKGRYRFNQAVKALYDMHEKKGSKPSEALLYFVDGKVPAAVTKENTSSRGKGENAEASNVKVTSGDNCDGVPDLVSACDSDTSVESEALQDSDGDDEMPELTSDSNESSMDEDDSDTSCSERRDRARREKKTNKQLVAMIKYEQAQEEEAKRIAKKDSERKKIVKQDKPKIKEVIPVDDVISLSEIKNKIEEILREGYKALVHKSFEQATERYKKALGMINAGARKSLEFGDKSYVVVLYAFGTAMLGMDVQKVESARRAFENIINSFKSVEFPLAYYGLGQALCQQNRYQEAILSLEEALTIVGDRSFEVVYWPGTDIVVEESLKKNTKAVLENLLTRCKYPPKPDATCRSLSCNRSRKTIYVNDSDYEGHIRIFCNEACNIEYHIFCWKKLKSRYIDKSTEKDFLDNECFTLDCFGQIIRIQIHDADGLKDEFQSAKVKLKKETKAVKNAPSTADVASKKKKRPKRQDSKPDVLQKEPDPSENQVKENGPEVNVATEPTVVIPKETQVVPDKESENGANPNESSDVTEFPANGMFVLKKTDEEPSLQNAKQAKGKNKKKKKNVQSLDEFLGRESEHFRPPRSSHYDDEDYDEIPAEPFTRKPPPGWMENNPFVIPAHLQEEAREIEDSLRTYSGNDNMYRGSDPWQMDSIREYVYSSFIQLLKVRGSLHVESEPMNENLSVLPEEAQSLVEADGGLLQFLSQSNLFTIELGVVTNREEKLFTDISKSFKTAKNVDSENNSLPGNQNAVTSAKIDQQEGKKSAPLFKQKPETMHSLSSMNGVVQKPNTNDSKVDSSFADLNHNAKEGLSEDGTDLNRNKRKNSGKTAACCTDKKNNLGHSKAIPPPEKPGCVKSNDVVTASSLSALAMDCKPQLGSLLKSSEETVSLTDILTAKIRAAKSAISNDLTDCKKTKEQNESDNKTQAPITSPPVDVKVTKDKGVQAKPNVKTKIVMTEPMIEPYKIEYEKLLYESETSNLKRQEAVEKNDKMQRSLYQQILNLNKKIQDLEKHKQSSNKKLEELEVHYQQEIKEFHRQKKEGDENIKKLREQFASKSKTDEGRIEVLETTLAEQKNHYQEDSERLHAETKNVTKFKTLSQQQAQRACNAEVKLLEVQRDVSFGIYTRAMQEAEITLHNITKMLAVNPSPPLHEVSKKWQRYIAECKIQMTHNKSQFDTCIPQVKDGKPLGSLSSLQIAHPSPYPGPPILNVPPSIIPPPSQQPSQRSEASASTNGLPGKPGPSTVPPPTAKAEGSRPAVSETSSANQTNHRAENPSGGATGASKPASSQPGHKAPNSFEKIMSRLATLFPNYTRTEMTNFIKDVRASKNGSLTGLSFDDIVVCVSELVAKREGKAAKAVAQGGPSNDRQQTVAAVADVQNPIVSSLPKPAASPATPAPAPLSKPPVITFPGKAAPEPSKSIINGGGSQVVASSSKVKYEDDPCVICHDEMSNCTKNVVLDCSHKFHHDCIKKWLIGEQSTCPTCRVHALLPEEFPQLK